MDPKRQVGKAGSGRKGPLHLGQDPQEEAEKTDQNNQVAGNALPNDGPTRVGARSVDDEKKQRRKRREKLVSIKTTCVQDVRGRTP